MSNRDGSWSEDMTHFVYDYEKISRETGWTVDEIRSRGVAYCRRNRKQPTETEKAEIERRGYVPEHDGRLLYTRST